MYLALFAYAKTPKISYVWILIMTLPLVALRYTCKSQSGPSSYRYCAPLLYTVCMLFTVRLPMPAYHVNLKSSQLFPIPVKHIPSV